MYPIHHDHVSIVDKHRGCLSLIKNTLLNHGYQEVYAFPCTSILFDLIENEGYTPAVVITEFNMPLINGIDYLDNIREIHSDVYCIVITSHVYKTSHLKNKYKLIKKDIGFEKELLDEINSYYVCNLLKK